jgi:KTSC domain
VFQRVFSSTVQHISHDPSTGDMSVAWKDGKTSVYKDVPADLAQQVANAPSVGKALHALVKGQYPHEYEGARS